MGLMDLADITRRVHPSVGQTQRPARPIGLIFENSTIAYLFGYYLADISII